MRSRISSKGQVTVPVEARDALGLTVGTEIEFLVRESELVIRKGKSRTGDEPIDRLYGILTLPKSTDRLLEEMRGPGMRASTRRPRSTKPTRRKRLG